MATEIVRQTRTSIPDTLTSMEKGETLRFDAKTDGSYRTAYAAVRRCNENRDTDGGKCFKIESFDNDTAYEITRLS